MPDLSPIIHTIDLSVGYRNKVVASDINASLMPGKVTLLLGPNGIGKSTLLRTICNLQPPLCGKVMIDGRSTKTISTADMSKLVAIVHTERNRAGGLTVDELVATGRMPFTGFSGRLSHEDKAIVEKAMADLGIVRFAKRQVANLSDGERQKAYIAKALAQSTPILILDEPTSFLDVAARMETLAIITQLAHVENKAVLMSTHDVADALPTADNAWLISTKGFVSGPVKNLVEGDCFDNLFNSSAVSFDRKKMSFVYR